MNDLTKPWEYQLITGKMISELNGKINYLMKQGWSLYGSPTAASIGGNLEYAQAMTREEVPKVA